MGYGTKGFGRIVVGRLLTTGSWQILLLWASILCVAINVHPSLFITKLLA